jgi:plasmid stabilization system protein ParE
MELKIFWTDFAKAELKENFKYLREKSGLSVAKNEIKKIVSQTLRLKKQAEIGQIEPMLKERNIEFLYSYKIKLIK